MDKETILYTYSDLDRIIHYTVRDAFTRMRMCGMILSIARGLLHTDCAEDTCSGGLELSPKYEGNYSLALGRAQIKTRTIDREREGVKSLNIR